MAGDERSMKRIVTNMGWTLPKVTKSLPVILVLLASCFLVYLISCYSQSLFINGTGADCPPLPTRSEERGQSLDPGRELVEAIKEARRVASSKFNGSTGELKLSAEGREAWNHRHPCQSRGSQGLVSFYDWRKQAKSIPANPLWDEVFQEYSELHRACTQKVGDIGEYFLQKNVSSGCKFVIADIASYTGFGNKILVLASSLLYAIITQRVILIPASTLVPFAMCEPFAGSLWALNDSRFPIPPTSFKDVWKLDNDMFRDIDRSQRRCSSPFTGAYAAGIRTNQWQPQQRFYCTREQSAYAEVTFVYLSGCVYTIPKLFATPMFRPALEALFPDKLVITRLLRSAFLPADPVWNRVWRLEHAYLEPAYRRIGIQLRYGGRGLPHYEEMNDIINERIVDCLIENHILPDVSHSSEEAYALPQTKKPPVIQVFIASLFVGLKDHLSRIYLPNPTVTGETIGLVQVTHNGHQEFGLQEDIEAFTEALLLSFADDLLVTPVSTLGSLAHGYGALTPWFIEVRKNSSGHVYKACKRGQTVEACNQFTGKRYSCSGDPSVDGKFFTDVLPYVSDCLTIDHREGLQLVTTFRS